MDSPNQQGADSAAGPERDRGAAPLSIGIGRRPNIPAVRRAIICDGSAIAMHIAYGYVRKRQHVNTVMCAATNAFWKGTESACGGLNGRAAGR